MRDFQIQCGDAREVLRSMPGASFDGCLCDPPYGLSSTEKRNMRRMSPRAASRNRASGFMGMQWDAAVPDAELWAAVLRVLKPGSPLLAFGGARTFHRLASAIEDAGFVLTDTLCWLHGQGFPKGQAQLKPAWEPITLAFKRGKRRQLAIDGCRIETNGFDDYQQNCSGDRGHDQNRRRRSGFSLTAGHAPSVGRWPANVIVDEHAARELDRQSGMLKSGANPTQRRAAKTRNVFARFQGQQNCTPHRGQDSGGASRFFYCAKASRKERGEENTHPTVKPIRLCEYLARLILPPGTGSRLVVPFAGSGSEMIAALRAGWGTVLGIEIESRYARLARTRIERALGIDDASGEEVLEASTCKA